MSKLIAEVWLAAAQKPVRGELSGAIFIPSFFSLPVTIYQGSARYMIRCWLL